MAWLRRSKPAPAAQTPQLTREQALACVPVVNAQVVWERSGDLVRLRYPMAYKPWFSGLSRRLGADPDKPMQKTLELDPMGSTVWGWLDNRRSVAELSTLLAERYGLQPREAEVSMTAFLRELGRRGVVAMRGADGNT